jgi:nickel transport protein
MGHRAEYSISADELRGAAGLIKEEPEESVSVISPETSSVDLKEIQSLIEDALDEKLKPIMREIKKSQEDKISPTEIIGGIGYIIGFFGILAYFLSRKR